WLFVRIVVVDEIQRLTYEYPVRRSPFLYRLDQGLFAGFMATTSLFKSGLTSCKRSRIVRVLGERLESHAIEIKVRSRDRGLFG
ncbi:hypothetical protein GT037_005182, partial [Alternaria burnsii]